MEEPKKNNSIVIGTVIVLVIAIASYGFFQVTKKTAPVGIVVPPTETGVVNPPVLPPVTQPTGTTSASTYKDGSYSAVGSYASPNGTEQIGVKLTLKNDVIESVDVTPMARGTSARFQSIFAANYKPLVMGKKIDQVSLDKVSGSSLSPQGFNDAISKIKSQAKS